MPNSQPSKVSWPSLWLALLLWLASGLLWAQDKDGLLAVPAPSSVVVDLTATLSTEQQAALAQRLQAFEQRKGSQLAVLLVPTTQPETIEQFALRVAEKWQPGRKKIDDGAILVVAKNERTLRIEVGYGLEGALNDATAKRIIDDIIVPQFKRGDFYGGINLGVEAMMRVVDGEALPAPAAREPLPDSALGFLPVIFVAAMVVGGIMRSLLGRAGGAFATGALLGLAGWLMLGLSVALLAAVLGFVLTLVGGRMGSSLGRYGGYGNGWGGSGGGGGFRGGGGGFGGGGASGRW